MASNKIYRFDNLKDTEELQKLALSSDSDKSEACDDTSDISDADRTELQDDNLDTEQDISSEDEESDEVEHEDLQSNVLLGKDVCMYVCKHWLPVGNYNCLQEQ